MISHACFKPVELEPTKPSAVGKLKKSHKTGLYK